MLPHYSPLKVAETFSILSGLYPERIDLGIGRAPGTDMLTMHALQRDRRQRSSRRLREQLTELLAYRGPGARGSIPSPGSPALPGLPERPEPWLLGSSPQSALWAAELGLPYSFADFINPAARRSSPTTAVASSTRAPRRAALSIGVIAICADTDEEAERLASSSRMMLSLLRQGRLIPMPPPEKALRYLETREPHRAPAGAP